MPSDLTAARDVQLSAFPEIQADKPVGKIVGSVQTGTNADLIAKVERLWDLLDEAHDSLPWCECCDVMGRPCSIGAALGESTPEVPSDG